MEHDERPQGIKRELTQLAVCALLLATVWAVTHFGTLDRLPTLLLFLIPYLTAGLPILKEAAEKLLHREFLDEDFLMAVASIGALCIGEYPEAVAVMLFYRVGEVFEDYAVGKSRRSIAALTEIRPDYANIETEAGLMRVAPETVEIGTVITVCPGERIPLDGIVTEGSSTLDTSALTGEAKPREVNVGQTVASGCVNISGLLKIRVTSVFAESTVSKILELAENSMQSKSRRETLITRFARVYTPVVVGCAVLLAVIPPLVSDAAFSEWLRRALIFLVISCPCALVVSVPLSFFGGMGCAAKRGILIKGSTYIEALADASIVALDKTGTVTEGSFTVTEVSPVGMSGDALLRLAAAAESYSGHPIGRALRDACPDPVPEREVKNVREIPGRGISSEVCGHRVAVGNAALMRSCRIAFPETDKDAAVVHVSVDGLYAGHVVIDDRIKSGAKQAVRSLRSLGVGKIVMLTGDTSATARAVAAQLGADQVMAELLPEDKVAAVAEFMREKHGGTLLFVGDGVNDAPVLARSDAGIAMGALGSDAAIEAADVVLMDDDLGKLPEAIRISRRTVRIAKQNIWLALTVKFVIMILGAFGIAGMWPAVFADVGVLLLALLNASRTLIATKAQGNI